jgi:hypothetical protein
VKADPSSAQSVQKATAVLLKPHKTPRSDEPNVNIPLVNPYMEPVHLGELPNEQEKTPTARWAFLL